MAPATSGLHLLHLSLHPGHCPRHTKQALLRVLPQMSMWLMPSFHSRANKKYFPWGGKKDLFSLFSPFAFPYILSYMEVHRLIIYFIWNLYKSIPYQLINTSIERQLLSSILNLLVHGHGMFLNFSYKYFVVFKVKVLEVIN